MSLNEKLVKLCPRHKRKTKSQQGFRCICKETSSAFKMGVIAVRQGRIS